MPIGSTSGRERLVDTSVCPSDSQSRGDTARKGRALGEVGVGTPGAPQFPIRHLEGNSVRYSFGSVFIVGGVIGLFARESVQRSALRSQSQIWGKRFSETRLRIMRAVFVFACVVVIVLGVLALLGVTDLKRR